MGRDVQLAAWEGVAMTGRRVLLLVAGLVVGYVLSGFVLGPGYLAVVVGVLVGVGAAMLFGK